MIIAVLDNYTGLEKFFAVCAVIGGILFLIRLILQFVGGDSDVDGDFDADIDTDVDADDSDISFKVLSFQGLTAFFMMFGLVGLTLMRQFEWEWQRAIIVASAAGVGTVWVMKCIFNAAKQLQSSGNFNMKNAIGQEGDVYLTIPAKGTGKVRVSVQESLKVWNAVSDGNQPIETGQRIKVVRIVSNNVLVVEKIS